MILFPKIGGVYWYVTDAWEKFFAVPVRVIARGGLFRYCHRTPALFTVEWQIVPPDEDRGDPGYCETYDASRRELYRTQDQAERAAERLNKLNAEVMS